MGLCAITSDIKVQCCYVGGCQNYGPFLGTLNNRCRTRIRTQKGTIILTTTHVYLFRRLTRVSGCGADPGLGLWIIGKLTRATSIRATFTRMTDNSHTMGIMSISRKDKHSMLLLLLLLSPLLLLGLLLLLPLRLLQILRRLRGRQRRLPFLLLLRYH